MKASERVQFALDVPSSELSYFLDWVQSNSDLTNDLYSIPRPKYAQIEHIFQQGDQYKVVISYERFDGNTEKILKDVRGKNKKPWMLKG